MQIHTGVFSFTTVESINIIESHLKQKPINFQRNNDLLEFIVENIRYSIWFPEHFRESEVILPHIDGHGVKVYLSLMEVFKWKEDANMTVNSRLKLFVW